tara:strand:- start:487 stop:642 length:156 start_codon:yes stop_codon:yes gene_type:complete
MIHSKEQAKHFALQKIIPNFKELELYYHASFSRCNEVCRTGTDPFLYKNSV